jgi:hypothetical protein
VAVAACLLLPAALSAQTGDDTFSTAMSDVDQAPDAADVDWSADIPAHIDDVQGVVTLVRDGEAVQTTGGTPLLSGDRLRTDAGRAEVLFADGSVLDLDERTAVEFLDDGLLRLDAGRVRLALAGRGSDSGYRIDGAGMTAWIETPGDYRVSVAGAAGGEELTLSAIRGVAELQSPLGRTRVRSGYATVSTVRDAPSLPYPDSASAGDAFDLWVLAERDARTNVRTASYLPDDLRPYAGTLASEGAWEYMAPYGYVWYPRVAVGWAPYTVGAWSVVASFGWTWTGGPRWIWPTHHYGRWGVHASRWYWIPDRRWAPAWVSWAAAPGYVGWCPLGWNNRPVVSVTRITVRTGGWRAWTVLPSHAFPRAGHRGFVRVSARDAVRGPLHVSRSAFTVHRVSPVRVAVSRTARPLRGPGYASRTSRSIDVAPRLRPGVANGGMSPSRERVESTRRPGVASPRAMGRDAWSTPARPSTSALPGRSSVTPSRSRGAVSRPSGVEMPRGIDRTPSRSRVERRRPTVTPARPAAPAAPRAYQRHAAPASPASPSTAPRTPRYSTAPAPARTTPRSGVSARMPSRSYRAPSVVRPAAPSSPRTAPSRESARPARTRQAVRPAPPRPSSRTSSSASRSARPAPTPRAPSHASSSSRGGASHARTRGTSQGGGGGHAHSRAR